MEKFEKDKNVSNVWLYNKGFDLLFIIFPAFFSVLFVFLFVNDFEMNESVPLWAWVVFILCVDVSHVYSTLFRTYFNKKEFQENKTLFSILPLAVFLIGVILYTIDSLLFWRVLAYTAVFHFIRQQYGFMRLYSRNDKISKYDRYLDKSMIYACTLYPIIYWHVSLPRNFRWFVDGDFLTGLPEVFAQLCFLFYVIIAILYLIKEAKNFIATAHLNIPKNLILLGTAVSWYVGIVMLNGDLAFTITNVVSHGIPYMALVWIYGRKEADKNESILFIRKLPYKVFFSRFSFPIFVSILILFGYIEEGLWAGLVWREHLEVFSIFSNLPAIRTHDTLSWLVPLLTLPQATHYVLDGFIWRIKDNTSNWYTVFFK